MGVRDCVRTSSAVKGKMNTVATVGIPGCSSSSSGAGPALLTVFVRHCTIRLSPNQQECMLVCYSGR